MELYHEFSNPEEVNEWVQRFYSDVISDTESTSAQAIYEYTGSWYKNINSLLRRDNIPPIGTEAFLTADYSYIQHYSKELEEYGFHDEFIDQSEEASQALRIYNKLQEYSLPEPIIAYRYVSKPLFRTYKREHTDKAFMSTSLLESVAKERLWENGIRGLFGNYVLKMYIPAGVHAIYVSQDQIEGNLLREYELLLEPNLNIEIGKRISIFPLKYECTVSKRSQP